MRGGRGWRKGINHATCKPHHLLLLSKAPSYYSNFHVLLLLHPVAYFTLYLICRYSTEETNTIHPISIPLHHYYKWLLIGDSKLTHLRLRGHTLDYCWGIATIFDTLYTLVYMFGQINGWSKAFVTLLSIEYGCPAINLPKFTRVKILRVSPSL